MGLWGCFSSRVRPGVVRGVWDFSRARRLDGVVYMGEGKRYDK